MKTEALLKDPVFQLNLLLWMAKDQPSNGYRVRPFFWQHGFRLVYIEQPFAFPVETVNAIDRSGLDASTKPEPDVILGRQKDAKALYFEAKAESFGPSSDNSRQARGHLLACGPSFGEVYAPLVHCLLCYVVPEGSRRPMGECLDALSTELRNKRLVPGPFSSHGLAVSATQINYSWDSAFKAHLGVAEDSVPVLDGISEDTDPAPLLLVFSDEDCANTDLRDFYRQALLHQTRANLLCRLHPLPLGTTYSTTPDDLLMETTDGVFQYLGRQRQGGLRRLVRDNFLKRIHAHWSSKQPGITMQGDRLTTTWSVPGEKEAFLDWLEDRRTRFEANRPSNEPPMLFDTQQ